MTGHVETMINIKQTPYINKQALKLVSATSHAIFINLLVLHISFLGEHAVD